jgi:hypothetical protein
MLLTTCPPSSLYSSVVPLARHGAHDWISESPTDPLRLRPPLDAVDPARRCGIRHRPSSRTSATTRRPEIHIVTYCLHVDSSPHTTRQKSLSGGAPLDIRAPKRKAAVWHRPCSPRRCVAWRRPSCLSGFVRGRTKFGSGRRRQDAHGRFVLGVEPERFRSSRHSRPDQKRLPLHGAAADAADASGRAGTVALRF